MVSAAIFDLDRTLLGGASGPVLAEALRSSGVGGRALPGERLVYGFFNALGETRAAMLLARQAATLSKGHPRDVVQKGAEAAAEALRDLVQPWAGHLLDEHRGAGRLLVLATATPYDLIKPLADLLGFDDVVATRYGVNADGTYDGTIQGPFVWSHGKLDAVRAWAEERGVHLTESWFYSDSVYDVPLLSAVGHPVAVNPDPRLALLAKARRWPTMHLDVPPGVPKVLGVELQRLGLLFARPELAPYCRFDIAGADRIPRRGPAIIVGNHRSYFDPMALTMLFGRAGRPVRFLGKKEVFDAPVVGQLATMMGGIRVDRGTGSDAPLLAAERALAAGELVALLPQGTIPRGRAFFEPELRGRWGAARLATASRAPVIPVGLWGTEHVWPRSARLPNLWNLTSPPTVRVRVGPPVTLEHDDVAADTERIMRAIVDLLPAEARIAREPTADELARTFPPGYRGDPDHEVERRPGTD